MEEGIVYESQYDDKDYERLLQDLIKRINLTEEERNLIFYKNAQRILGLKKS